MRKSEAIAHNRSDLKEFSPAQLNDVSGAKLDFGQQYTLGSMGFYGMLWGTIFEQEPLKPLKRA